MSEVDKVTEQAGGSDRKHSPGEGLFGFPGTTLFQPGQSKFSPGKAAIPFNPDRQDDTGGHTRAD